MRPPSTGAVSVRHGFTFCPEIIFDAFIDPEMIRKWLFVGPTSTIVKVDIDAREGGAFSILEQENTSGDEIDHYGKYQKVNRPGELVFTLSAPKHFPGETVVRIHITTQPGGCLLELTQTGVPPKTTEQSWRNMLEKLDNVLKEMAKKTL